MNKVIKIGFPIVCIVIIAGTFFLLNKTQKKANNQAKIANQVTKIENIDSTGTKEKKQEEQINNNEYAISLEEEEKRKRKEQENEEKAIELATRAYGDISNVYYSNEGMEDNKYIIAVRDISTTTAKIYYSIDIENEVVEIYY